jgi:hypothetical protein
MPRRHREAKKTNRRQKCPACGVLDGKPHKDSCPNGRCSRCGQPRGVLALCESCDTAVRSIASKPW